MDAMADKGNEDTFEHELAGRTMVFKKTSGTQMLVLQRYANVLKEKFEAAAEAGDEVEVTKLAKKLENITWETVESRFTSEEDLDWVQMKVVTGVLAEADLLAILTNGYKRPVEPDDDADPAPKKAAKKVARKATTPAQKAANQRRATR
jgi:hypothetical protein